MRFSFAKRCLETVVAVLVVGASAGWASAAVIDFESAATLSRCYTNFGGSVDGFSLSPSNNTTTGGGFNKATACQLIAPTANSGEQYMLQFGGRFGEFTKDDGTFTLDNLYVHADARMGDDSKVRFQGLDGIGGNVLYTLDAVIQATWQQIVFSDWIDVKTFTWQAITPGFSPDPSNISIDDFEYSVASSSAAARSFAAVPTPGTFALLGTGLAFLGVGRRRRNRAG